MNDRAIYVRHLRVVEVLAASPVAPIKSSARVAESIVDSTVEANRGPPIADVPNVEASRKSPITGCPEQTRAGRKYPGAWHPVVAFAAISVVTGFPDITWTRTDRLRVHGKNRWSNAHTDNDAYRRDRSRIGGDAQKSAREDQRAERYIDPHITHLSEAACVSSSNARRACRTPFLSASSTPNGISKAKRSKVQALEKIVWSGTNPARQWNFDKIRGKSRYRKTLSKNTFPSLLNSAISRATAFYKGESQERNFAGDWKEPRFLPGSPADVMLRGSWGSLFSQIHVVVVTAPSVSDATSSAVAKCQPQFYLRLGSYSIA
jgi:hypothetical protein